MNTLEFTWICLAFLSLTENVWTERKSSNAKSFAKFVKKAPWKKKKKKKITMHHTCQQRHCPQNDQIHSGSKVPKK